MRARLTRSAGRAAVFTRRAAALFPVRVWRRFLRRNGFLLSAGMAYQALFSMFALLYVAFATAGIWVSGSTQAIDALIGIINTYLPGFISEDGIATAEEVRAIAENATGAFTLAGAIAAGVVIWTASGAVTFTRRAVRDIFGLPFDTRNFALLKLGDAVTALCFGITLLLGAGISIAGVWALTQLFDVLGWSLGSKGYEYLVRASSVLLLIVIDTAAIAVLVRFLAGTSIRWRTIWPGAVFGGLAITVLQLGAGLLFTRSPGNPLLATFAVLVAVLLWCRLVAAVILLAASWIALAAADRNEPLEPPDAAAAAHAALAARAAQARRRLDGAAVDLAEARWWQRRELRADLHAAREEWEDATAALHASERGAIDVSGRR